MKTPRVIVDATTEPVSLAEVKFQAKIDDLVESAVNTAQNAAITRYIKAARKYFEKRTGRTIHQQTLEVALDGWPCGDIELPRSTPLIAVDSIKYRNSDAIETTWTAAEYIADTDQIPGRVVLGYQQSYPSFTAYPVSPIRVRYTAGIATTSPITEADELIKIPILLLVAGLWENRESEVITNMASIQGVAMSYGVEAFIAQNITTYVF